MTHDLEQIAAALGRAAAPEDVFGVLEGGGQAERLRSLTKVYHRLAKRAHPEAYVGNAQAYAYAQSLFGRLAQFRAAAEAKVREGTYGDRNVSPKEKKAGTATVITKRHVYVVGPCIAQGDLADVYNVSYEADGNGRRGVMKVVRDPRDNDLLQNEWRVLGRLHEEPERDAKLLKYIPRPIESFTGEDGMRRQVNVLSLVEGCYTLAEIKHHYTDGVHILDVAWMWRRLLTVIGFAHRHDIVHGAVIPPHVMIHPEDHGLALVDWCAAVIEPAKRNEHIRMASVEYEAFYPPEVFAKATPTPAADIYMAAKCMIDLLGGSVQSNALPGHIPKAFQTFFTSCVLGAPKLRGMDAWAIYDDFDALLKRVVGRPSFRSFVMPRRPREGG